MIGIFIGLQVDSWNQGRVDRADEQAYLARLTTDLAETLSALTFERNELTTWFEQTASVSRGLQAGEPGRVLVENNEDALSASTRVLIGRAQLATITELVEGGRLGIIRNPDIRGAIAATEGLAESRRLQVQVLSRQQQVLAEIIRARYRIVEGSDGNWGAVEYDFAALSRDELLINALSQAAENLRVNALWLDEVIEEMEALARLVAAERALMN